MEDFNQILQDQVRMEGEVFVVLLVGRIAMIDVPLLERLEIGVRRIILLDASIRLVRRMVVLHQPHIGILGLVEHRLEAQRDGSAIGVGVEQVIASGILV